MWRPTSGFPVTNQVISFSDHTKNAITRNRYYDNIGTIACNISYIIQTTWFSKIKCIKHKINAEKAAYFLSKVSVIDHLMRSKYTMSFINDY